MWRATVGAMMVLAFLVGAIAGQYLPWAEASPATDAAIAAQTVVGQAGITDPEAVRYVNEVVRPLSEEIRALKARTDAALVRWYAGINAKVPNDAQVLQDGRGGEGVSRLTGADIHNMMAILAALQGRLDQTGVAQTLAKPCVRPLEAR